MKESIWKVLCNRNISARINSRVCSRTIRPKMLYGLETVVLAKRQEDKVEVVELRFLRFAL